MNQGLKIAGLVVAGMVLVGASAFAGGMVAQAQTPVVGPAMMQGYRGPGGMMQPGAGMMQPGTGMMYGAGGGWMFEYHDQMWEALAKALDMTVDELNAALQSGKTVAEIAEEKGISTEDLQQAMLDAHAEVLAQAVKDGKLTQEQADQMLEYMKANPGMGWGYGYRMGPGMMNGYRGGPGFDGNRNFGPGRRGGMWGGPWGNPQQPAPTPDN
jgi:hypothetical protein